jgi:ATP-dependent DNA helicase RecG
MLSLESPIENLLKITKPQVAALKKLNIFNVRDLLLHFPYRYLDFSITKSISKLRPEENVSIKVKIKNISSRFSFRSRMSLAEAVVSDDTGSLKVTWFNQAYLAESLKPGDELFLAGKPDYYNSKLQLTNPIYEKVSDFPVHTSRMVPLYHLKQELYPKTFRNLIKQVLDLANQINDDLPKEVIQNQNLFSIAQTAKASHFPENLDDLAAAKKRLAFEEIFLSQLAAQQYKMLMQQKKAFSIPFSEKITKSFVDSLPFKLTDEQKKAAWQVLQDLEKPLPMNRLVEGDVGSGKTVVALMAALQVLREDLQIAFLAPTEILAQQHFATASKLFKIENYKLKISLLTNSYSQVNDKETTKLKLQQLISEGMPGLYIGTHALLSVKVKFKKLALVIIDEQHRFGVEQRAQLIDQKKKIPHLLSLTATPIPRTLQLAFYGALDISQIKTKPSNRKTIVTKLVNSNNRAKAYDFIRAQIKLGRQAFVITPLIEQTVGSEAKSAKKELENMEKVFPEFKIGLLHGKLKSAEKESVMAQFLANKINILVSTSVVEVGVDVPNASVMIIEDAEKFGLAQLHQFRGRVGRAEHQSYCFLFTAVSPSPPAGEGRGEGSNNSITRLEEFTKINDGFKLAELDLKQRGFGEVIGESQSGWNFKYFDHSYTSLIEPARKEAIKLLEKDLNLFEFPVLKQKISGTTVHFE